MGALAVVGCGDDDDTGDDGGGGDPDPTGTTAAGETPDPTATARPDPTATTAPDTSLVPTDGGQYRGIIYIGAALMVRCARYGLGSISKGVRASGRHAPFVRSGDREPVAGFPMPNHEGGFCHGA